MAALRVASVAVLAALVAPMEVRLQAAMAEAMAVMDQRAEPGQGCKEAPRVATVMPVAKAVMKVADEVARVPTVAD